MGFRSIAREVVLSAVSQRVFSAVTVLVIAGSTMAVLLISGKSAAAQAAVLQTIDDQETRVVILRAKVGEADFAATIVDELARIPEVESVVGFGQPRDATASAIPGGAKVGVRTVYGFTDTRHPWPASSEYQGSEVRTSAVASRVLGLPVGAGSVTVLDGADMLVTGGLSVPEFLDGLEPLVVIPPKLGANPRGVRLENIVVLVSKAENVELVSALARRLLVDFPPESTSVTSSDKLAALQLAVGDQLAAQGRSVLIGVIGGSSLLTVVNVCGLVVMRRRDFGRRRALGATRRLIVALVVGQILLAAVVAVVIGSAIAVGWLVMDGNPVPSPVYVLAVMTALTLTAALAAAVPAIVAASRDPIRELRVP